MTHFASVRPPTTHFPLVTGEQRMGKSTYPYRALMRHLELWEVTTHRTLKIKDVPVSSSIITIPKDLRVYPLVFPPCASSQMTGTLAPVTHQASPSDSAMLANSGDRSRLEMALRKMQVTHPDNLPHERSAMFF